MLWLLLRRPMLALGASVLLYALTWQFDWNLAAYPNGSWVFNPLAWQLLFVFGAWCGLGGAAQLAPFAGSRLGVGLGAAYLAFSFAIALSLYIPHISGYAPKLLRG